MGVIYFLFIYLYSHIFLLVCLQLLRINSVYSGGYTGGGGRVGVIRGGVIYLYSHIFIFMIFRIEKI